MHHRRDVYFDSIGYKDHPYDFFLIVTKDIFSSDAKFLAELVQKENKKFYLVRTLIDCSIEAELKHNEDMTDEKVTLIVRQNLVAELGELGFDTEQIKVYIVNCEKPDQHDFPSLQQDICDDSMSERKKEALLLTIRACGKQMIDLKYKMFKKRIYTVALASAAGGAVPIPGVGATVALVILIEELLTYFVGYGLRRGAIASLEKLNELEPGTIEKTIAGSMENYHKLLFVIRKETPETILTKERSNNCSFDNCQGMLLSYLG